MPLCFTVDKFNNEFDHFEVLFFCFVFFTNQKTTNRKKAHCVADTDLARLCSLVHATAQIQVHVVSSTEVNASP